MRLPRHILDFLEQSNYELGKVVQFNSWKKTFVLQVQKDNEGFILKAIGNDSPQDIKDKFLEEVSIYTSIKSKHIPRLYFASDQILVVELLKGKTLRQYLDETEPADSTMEKLTQAIKAFYSESLKNSIDPPDFHNAHANLISLARSGPMQTKKLPLLEEAINRAITVLLRKKLLKALKIIDPAQLRFGFSHGDFHYNNIFITNENEIKFIDFENSAHNQCFDFDLLYLLTMMEGIRPLSRSEKKDPFLPFRELIDEKEGLKSIFELYQLAARINPRFSKNAMKVPQRIVTAFLLATSKDIRSIS